jgi:hypothetical protein
MNDAADKVRFDLPSGSVRDGGGHRVLLLPSSALEELGRTAGVEVARALSRAMGVALGKGLVARLGSPESVRSSSLEAVVGALASELAVAGWGSVSLERWGRAMVMLVEHPAVDDRTYVAATLEGALREATGRAVHCISLGGEGPLRILVAGDRAVARAKEWLAAGTAWGDVLSRLQAGGGVA